MNNLQAKLLNLFLRNILDDLLNDMEDTEFNINYNNILHYHYLKFLKYKIKKIKSFLSYSRHDKFNRNSLVGINLKRFYFLTKCPHYESLDNYLSSYNLTVFIFHGIITIPYGYIPVMFQKFHD